MIKFSDQLLDDMMREHGPALPHTRPPARPKRRVTPRRARRDRGGALALAVAGAVTVASIAVAAIESPAYAVTKNPDGTITVAVHQTSGIAGANAMLRRLGDGRVVVVPVEPGCPSPGSLPPPAVPERGHQIATQTAISRNGSVTVNAQGIPAGDILVVGVKTDGRSSLGGAALTSPPAPSCLRLPALPAGNGSSR
jgi:hypothetical protein